MFLKYLLKNDFLYISIQSTKIVSILCDNNEIFVDLLPKTKSKDILMRISRKKFSARVGLTVGYVMNHTHMQRNAIIDCKQDG